VWLLRQGVLGLWSFREVIPNGPVTMDGGEHCETERNGMLHILLAIICSIGLAFYGLDHL
jgi:hypothetical protein